MPYPKSLTFFLKIIVPANPSGIRVKESDCYGLKFWLFFLLDVQILAGYLTPLILCFFIGVLGVLVTF